MFMFEVGKTYIYYNGYSVKRMYVISRTNKTILADIDGIEQRLKLYSFDNFEYIKRKCYEITAQQYERGWNNEY